MAIIVRLQRVWFNPFEFKLTMTVIGANESAESNTAPALQFPDLSRYQNHAGGLLRPKLAVGERWREAC